MRSYSVNEAWQRKYIDPAKNIIGPHLLRDASISEDTQMATDIVLRVSGHGRPFSIGMRMRRHGFAEKYGHEFTIRSCSMNATTELAKFRSGFCDWFFYGHEDRAGAAIARWMIIDIQAWRVHDQNEPRVRFKDKDNHDGTYFRAYDVRDFPPIPPIVIAASFQIERRNHRPVELSAGQQQAQGALF